MFWIECWGCYLFSVDGWDNYHNIDTYVSIFYSIQTEQ